MRLFYVLYPEEPDLRFALDAIRFVANPYEKERAHLTVRGPCSRHYQEKTLERLNAHIVDSPISISGVDRFFGERQNTVFLSCESETLRLVWRKPDYGYHPHITLYDGDSRELGTALLDLLGVLGAESPSLRFRAGGLQPLRTFKGQTNLTLRASVDFQRLGALWGRACSAEVVAGFGRAERLDLIGRIWQSLGRSLRGR